MQDGGTAHPTTQSTHDAFYAYKTIFRVGCSKSIVTRLRARWPGFNSWQGQRGSFFLVATASRPALGFSFPLDTGVSFLVRKTAGAWS